jgi:disulfide bond formation protein DsbB
MAAMTALSLRMSGLTAAVAAAAALGIATGSETWGGLVPCALCLVERWPYRVAIVLGLAAAVLPRSPARVAMALLALAVLTGAVFAAIHVGVEFHWWPSPLPECAAPVVKGGSFADLPALPSKPCDDPTYLVPGLPLSMAAMNLIFASLFTLAAAWAAARRPTS